jgi:cysteine-rich repeat protein
VQEALYLCASDGLSVLELSPLLQVRTDPGTRREALYLWDGTEGDRHRLWLRNDDTSHRELAAVQVDGRDTTFRAWLKERAARTTVLTLGPTTQGLGTRLPHDLSPSTVASLTERFVPLEPLGEGGMAVVWRVKDALTGEVSALKVLKEGLAEDDVARDRFLREARTLSAIEHPRIVPVLEVLEWPGGGLGLRMPVFERGSVRDVVEDAPATAAQVRAWLIDALDALSFLHARGIVHRDVKPQNLLMGDDGRLQLTDFGIALGPDDARLTQTREALGTTGYMAPEQLRAGQVGPAADIHALGISAHEWLTGELPSGGAGRHLDAPLGPMLAAMTAQEPDERPDAKTILVRLGTRPTFPTDLPPRTTRAGTPPAAGPAVRRRRPLAVWAGLLAVACAFGLPASRARIGRLLAAGSCGNGVLDEGEACDDGNGVGSDACANDCRPNAVFLHGMGPQQTYWWMGARSPCTNHRDCDREQPATPVLSDPFWLAKTETTVESYVAWANKAKVFVSAALRERAAREPGFPVADVTYDEARRVCAAMGGRLPSEAEWEYAARDGGREVEFPWGDERLDCERPSTGTTAARTEPPGPSARGPSATTPPGSATSPATSGNGSSRPSTRRPTPARRGSGHIRGCRTTAVRSVPPATSRTCRARTSSAAAASGTPSPTGTGHGPVTPSSPGTSRTTSASGVPGTARTFRRRGSRVGRAPCRTSALPACSGPGDPICSAHLPSARGQHWQEATRNNPGAGFRAGERGRGPGEGRSAGVGALFGPKNRKMPE